MNVLLIVAKVEWHAGELFPRVGFLVTNLTWPPKQVVRFYNRRVTAAHGRLPDRKSSYHRLAESRALHRFAFPRVEAGDVMLTFMILVS